MRQIQLHDTGAVIQLLNSNEVEFIDSFQVVRAESGEVVATVEATYHSDDRQPSVRLVKTDALIGLPFVTSDEHLISCVMYSILAAFTEDHTFYSEAFSDEEGNGVALPLYALGF